MPFRSVPLRTIAVLVLVAMCTALLLPFHQASSTVFAEDGGEGLIAYWRMEEGVGSDVVVDSAGHGYDQHLVNLPGRPDWSPDAPFEANSGSLAFDGQDDYTYSFQIGELAGRTQMTVEAWVKFDQLTGRLDTLVSSYRDGLVSQWWFGAYPGGELLVALLDRPTGDLYLSSVPTARTQGASLQPNAWYHVAFVYDGSGATNGEKLQIFVNGESQQQLIFNSGRPIPAVLPDVEPSISLGWDPYGFYGQGALDGNLDEVRIYNVARSSTDIAADAAGQTAAVSPPPPEPPAPAPVPGDPVAYWKMEEAVGGVVVDSSGNGHDQHLVSEPATAGLSADVPTLLEGNNASLAFDGTDDYTYSFPIQGAAGTSALTVEAWVKFDTMPWAFRTMVSAWHDYMSHWWFGTPGPPELRVWLDDGTGVGPVANTIGVNMQAGRWYHVAFVYDGAAATNDEQLKVYVDGVQYPVVFQNTRARLGSTLAGGDPVITLGGDVYLFQAQAPLDGNLDEVRIYNVARSSTDIAADAAGQTAAVSPPPPEPPAPAPVPGDPVAYWKMEEAVGGVVVDSSGNGHDLHLASEPAMPASSADVPTLLEGNNASLAFDGTDDYTYSFPIQGTAGTSALTVEAWVKFDTMPWAFRTMVSAWHDYMSHWWFGTPEPPELRVWLDDGTGVGPVANTIGVNMQAGRWYHVAFVYDGAAATNDEQLKVYVDGVQYPVVFQNTRARLGSTLSGAEPVVTVGGDAVMGWAQAPLDGNLDEVRIYNVARSSSDIAADAAGQTWTSNSPPVVSADSASVVVNEGQVASNTGIYSDPDAGDDVSVSASVGSVVKTGTNSGSWTWSLLTTDGSAESQIVTIAVTDSGELTARTSFDLVVNNVAPLVGPISAPTEPLPVNTSIVVSAAFQDPGTADTHHAIWEWGDGSQCDTTSDPGCSLVQGAGSGSVNGAHTYAEAGVYTLRLAVGDDDGGWGELLYRYVVVYDPSGGFVTGNGRLYSQPGAYAPDPLLEGPAAFGFVSKYKKGQSEPIGNTTFEFQVGDLSFVSTAYEWLVVAGPKAMYKGSGTINGAGDYGFLVSAIDGQLNGGGGSDKYRIKIWDKNAGNGVVYDNQMGAPDEADPATVIVAGSIVIHKQK